MISKINNNFKIRKKNRRKIYNPKFNNHKMAPKKRTSIKCIRADKAAVALQLNHQNTT